MKPKWLAFLAVALVLTFGTSSLYAMFDAFLKIEGVPGESTDSSHKDWIEVLSYSHAALSQGTRSAAGGGAAERLSIRSLTLTMKRDKATPKLYEAATKGTHYPSVILHVRKAGGGSLEYLEYKLTDVLVTSVRPGGTGGAQPTESLSINFTKIELVYKEQGKPPAGQVQGAAALSKAGAVTPPTPTATPVGAAPKR